MAMRQSDLMFSCQTERSLRAWTARYGAISEQRQRIDIVRTSYAADAVGTAMKSWDFSETAGSRRWTAGCRDMQAALQEFRFRPPGELGLDVQPIVRSRA
jgi:hypothetical protein